ncbi:signal peptidase I [Bacillus timonensis]|uniref:Signal peptidase I n=1 Tax=Bacillus timonensis TaxID=1033734 RepID=A0A4S3PRK7_9BACI|nr:signal peptidase I [Bacillus timonensis]THE12331.1 signal peptidase I [Bacillus timonensis]
MFKKAFKRMGNILFVLLIIISISGLFSILQSKKEPGHLPSILGYKVMTVLTGSMEPLLQPGDVIVVKPINFAKVKVNDVITYRNSQNTLVTHRVIELVDQEGEVFFQTKGDANNVKDDGLVAHQQLVGSLLFHIPKAGYIATFIKSPIGLILLVSVPLLSLTIGMIKKIMAVDGQEKSEI